MADFFPSPIISRLAVGQKNFDSSLSLILSSYLFFAGKSRPVNFKERSAKKRGREVKNTSRPQESGLFPPFVGRRYGHQEWAWGEGDKEDTFFGRRHLNGLQAPPAQKDGGMGEWGIRPRMPRISLCVLRG